MRFHKESHASKLFEALQDFAWNTFGSHEICMKNSQGARRRTGKSIPAPEGRQYWTGAGAGQDIEWLTP
jgi:hypothetical protein